MIFSLLEFEESEICVTQRKDSLVMNVMNHYVVGKVHRPRFVHAMCRRLSHKFDVLLWKQDSAFSKYGTVPSEPTRMYALRNVVFGLRVEYCFSMRPLPQWLCGLFSTSPYTSSPQAPVRQPPQDVAQHVIYRLGNFGMRLQLLYTCAFASPIIIVCFSLRAQMRELLSPREAVS